MATPANKTQVLETPSTIIGEPEINSHSTLTERPVKKPLSDNTISHWRQTLEMITEVGNIQVAFIAKIDRGKMKIIASNLAGDKPLGSNNTLDIPSGSFLEYLTQTASAEPLANNPDELRWRQCWESSIGFGSFLGQTIENGSGEMYGVICFLNGKKTRFTKKQRKLLAAIKRMVETDLARENLPESDNYSPLELIPGITRGNSIFNFMTDAIHVVDRDLNIILFNESFKKWDLKLGLDSNPVGRGLSDVFPFLDDAVLDQYRHTFNSGEIHYSEERNIINGEEIFTETRKVPIHNNGRIEYIITIIRDTTGIVRSEAQIREQHDFLCNVIDSLEYPFYVVNVKDYSIVLTNTKIGNIENGVPCHSLIHNSQRPCWQENHPCPIEIVRRTKQTAVVEHLLYDKEGRLREFELHCHPLFDDNGEVDQVLEFSIDITERKRAQETLRNSHRRYQELFNSVMEGIGMIDENEQIIYCNPSLVRIFEVDSEKNLVGESILDFMPEEKREAARSRIRGEQKLNGHRFEMEITVGSGNIKTVLLSVSRKRDGYDNYSGAIIAIIDISEVRRLQEFASRAQRLETAGRIAGQVAHDFNNLLAPLIAYPGFIKEMLPDDHDCVVYLNDMSSAAERIAEINQQLLTLGRRGHFHLEVINLNETIEQVIGQLSPIPETMKIETEFAEDLSNIKGGSAQIMRILINMLSNARDSMHDDGTIKITTENYILRGPGGKNRPVPGGKYIRVSISDTGSGIPGDALAKIFDPFFTTKTAGKKRGSGLGLSVVHSVIEDHHGYIDLETTPGEGTVFYLYFPVTGENLKTQISEEIVGGQEKILVVDDDDMQRDVSHKLLRSLGYNVVTVSNGNDAVDYIKNNNVDLVLLDMVMPDSIDGLETYKAIREINSTQKTIVVSGHAESEKVKKTLELGASSFLRKPLTIKSVAGAVRKELDRLPG